MSERTLCLTAAVAGIAVGALGCAFVELSDAGRQVWLLPDESRASECERVGKTTSGVAARVGFWKRDASAVRRDLAILARNDAASELGGNAVAPLGEPTEDGRQAFAVFRCEDPAGQFGGGANR
ncbi:MAG: DUF4156 domain-containing protein [Proteobacteria bacterium]|nr:DUF4156 domain-containing protein [Pseudomonadota bacterium]